MNMNTFSKRSSISISIVILYAAIPSLAFGQLGMFPIQTSNKLLPTYIIDIIPGAANRNATEHYYPSDIAIPEGTTVGWFNDDPGQPHTVTSGTANSQHSGLLFNSGVMPYGSFMQYTFDEVGDYIYHCMIHPWRIGAVHVSLAYEKGINFILRPGTDVGSYDTQYSWVFNTTQHDRTLLEFKPTTITVDGTTPLTYNITLLDTDMKPIFSRSLFVIGNDLQVELIQSNNNQTTFYGPDFSDPITGVYHIQSKFTPGEYVLRAEITAIGSKIPEKQLFDDFKGKIIS